VSSFKPTPLIHRVAPQPTRSEDESFCVCGPLRVGFARSRPRKVTLSPRLLPRAHTSVHFSIVSTNRSFAHPFRVPTSRLCAPIVPSFRVGSPNGHRVSGCICLRSGRPPSCGAPRSPVVTSVTPTLLFSSRWPCGTTFAGFRTKWTTPLHLSTVLCLLFFCVIF
jgi:hypothetical protein